MSNSDERLKKAAGDDRTSRAMEDRAVTESRELSDDDRVAMFQNSFFTERLPNLPAIPGYHVVWLTTTNAGDSIANRIRLGYEPIKAEDIPGWDYVSIKSGEYQGFIGVNEMLAFKLRDSLYQRYMLEVHHNAPNREAGKMTDTLKFIQDQKQKKGSVAEISEGFDEMLNPQSRPPTF